MRVIRFQSDGTRYLAALDRLTGEHVTGRSATQAWNERIMKAATYIQRGVGIIALAALSGRERVRDPARSRAGSTPSLRRCGVPRPESLKKRSWRTRFQKAEGKLRFRCGPLRGYRLKAVIVEVGAGKVRVELELHTNVRGIDKDAWRNGDRYLSLVAQRLQAGGAK